MVDRREHGRLRRHRMKQPGARLDPEFLGNRTQHRVDVADHMRVVVIRRVAPRIVPVVAHVEHGDLELGHEPAPERGIPVGRKTGAVADEQPDRARLAVQPHTDRRAAGPWDVEGRARRQLAVASAAARLRPRVSGSISSIRIISPDASTQNSTMAWPSGMYPEANPTIVGKNDPIARPPL